MKYKLALSGILSVAAAVAMTSNTSSFAKGRDDANLVTICHFKGHDGDFVTLNSEASPNNFCVRRGGNPITVGENACRNGHGAEDFRPKNRFCDDGHRQGN